MAQKKLGSNTIQFQNPLFIVGNGTVAGPNECKGPLGSYFDIQLTEDTWQEDTYEKAELKMYYTAVRKAIQNAGKTKEDIEFMLGGDLLNQIVTSGYSARQLEIPFLGLYGACSTMAESLIVGSMIVDGGFADHVVCAASSHFATAERQFRYPLELGTPKPPTGQNTVTGAGATVLSTTDNKKDGICPTIATIGSVVDMGITDANNMGAAMAPAAAQTILTHLEDTGRDVSYYDLIVTGDLGSFGSELLFEICADRGVKLKDNFLDCGCLIFDGLADTYCGGSGCGCSAITLNGYLMDQMKKGKLNKMFFVATGALLSPMVVQQGESIPSIAHGIAIERKKS